MPTQTQSERTEAIRRGLIRPTSSSERAIAQQGRAERQSRKESVRKKGGRYGRKYYRKSRSGTLIEVSQEEYEKEAEIPVDMSRRAREQRDKDKQATKLTPQQLGSLKRYGTTKITQKEIEEAKAGTPLYTFSAYGSLYEKSRKIREKKELKLKKAKKEFKFSPKGRLYKEHPELQPSLRIAPERTMGQKLKSSPEIRGATLLPRAVYKFVKSRGKEMIDPRKENRMTSSERKRYSLGMTSFVTLPVTAPRIGVAGAIKLGKEVATVGAVGSVAEQSIKSFKAPSGISPMKIRAVEKKFTPEINMGKYLERKSGFLETVLPEKFKPQKTFSTYLKSRGLTSTEIQIAKRVKFGAKAKYTTEFIGAGVVGEITGTTKVFKVLKPSKEVFTKKQLFGKVSPELFKAGIKEAGIQEFGRQRYTGEEFSPTKIGKSAFIGGTTAGTLGGGIIATAVHRKGVSRAGLVGAYALDPAEYISDILAKPLMRGKGTKLAKFGKRIKVHTPSIPSPTITTPTPISTRTTIRTRTRTPTISAPTPTPTTTPLSTFLPTPTITTTPTPIITPTPTPISTSLFTPTTTSTTTTTLTPTSTPIITPTFKGFGLPPFFGSLGGGSGGGISFGFPKSKKQKKSYTPSLTAIGLGIKGTATKGGILSGLGIRPLPKSKLKIKF